MKPYSRPDGTKQTFTCAILIPSYKEFLALPSFLEELSPNLDSSDLVIICDDTNENSKHLIIEGCKRAFAMSEASLLFSMVGKKSGRGGAVRRGMEFAVQNYNDLIFVIECDADGSHRPIDIMELKNHASRADLLIGSRYLPESQIIGWPISRRLFSWSLNKIIPKFLDLKLTDITNGLRRYSLPAVKAILSAPAQNTSFTYLSEQVAIVKYKKMAIEEIPTKFINRKEGKSTVGWREIFGSLIGILRLFASKKGYVGRN